MVKGQESEHWRKYKTMVRASPFSKEVQVDALVARSVSTTHVDTSLNKACLAGLLLILGRVLRLSASNRTSSAVLELFLLLLLLLLLLPVKLRAKSPA